MVAASGEGTVGNAAGAGSAAVVSPTAEAEAENAGRKWVRLTLGRCGVIQQDKGRKRYLAIPFSLLLPRLWFALRGDDVVSVDKLA